MSTSSDPAGALQRDLCNFLGALFLSVLTERIFDRGTAEEGAGRLHLYLDEYQRFATSTTAELLTEARKYNIGVTLAHQTRARLDEENKEAELQTGTLICTKLTPTDAQDVAPAFPVVPPPQKEERVEEIEGTEPELAPTREAFEQLIETGHSNEVVQRIIGEHLEPLYEAVEKAREGYENSVRGWEEDLRDRRFGYSSPPRKPEELLELIPTINRLLMDVMWKDVSPSSDEAIERISKIICGLGDYVKVWNPHSSKEACNSAERVRELIDECVRAKLADQASLQACEAELFRFLEECDVYPWDPRTVRTERFEDFDKRRYEEEVREKRWENVRKVGQLASALQTLCEHVYRDPMLVKTGQERPRKRVRYIMCRRSRISPA